MRLVVFGTGHPYRGGVARDTTLLVRALENRGNEMLFLTPSRQYPAWLYPGKDDRDPDACPKLECAEAVLDPMRPMSWAASKSTARDFSADAWLMPYWTWVWAGLWRWLLGGRRPPAVAIAHNPADHGAGFVKRAAASSVLRRCDAIFTHARILEEELAGAYPGLPTASYPLPAPDIGVLPDRAAARSQLDLPDDRRVALFLGLIRPYKGVELLLKAVASQDPGDQWFLVLAGEAWGGLGRDLQRMIDEFGIEDRVRLRLGWVPTAEVPALLAAADLMVLPYRSGSMSALPSLALSLGLPVLSTRVGGLPEVVEDGVNGILVEPGSADALARAFAELDGPKLAELTAGARGTRSRFTWDEYAATIEGLIAQVVS
jgi:glycosyltransferase involved in cell wall biosynthesis